MGETNFTDLAKTICFLHAVVLNFFLIHKIVYSEGYIFINIKFEMRLRVFSYVIVKPGWTTIQNL